MAKSHQITARQLGPNPAADAHMGTLSPLVIRMAGHAESQLQLAMNAVIRRDARTAARVSPGDHVLDDLQVQIDRQAQELLIRHRPSQANLHEILGAMRIAGDLERVGDYAANIAKRVEPLAEFRDLPPIGAVDRMGRLVQELLHGVVTAYSRRDLSGAIDAWHRDEDLDDLYTSLHRELLTYMIEDPRNITGYIHILFIAKNVERIGDHATNIAEQVHLMISGEPFDKARPKGDETPGHVVRPVAKDTGGQD
ncbi:MAG: phosphate signaling complex protein PhoU [Pseudomonadota bacterium]